VTPFGSGTAVVIGGGLAEKLGQDLADRIAGATAPWMLRPDPDPRFVAAGLGTTRAWRVRPRSRGCSSSVAEHPLGIRRPHGVKTCCGVPLPCAWI